MYDEFIKQAIGLVFGYGLIGIVAAAGWYAAVKLYYRNQELNSSLYEAGKEYSKITSELTTALNKLSDLTKNNSEKIEDNTDTVQRLYEFAISSGRFGGRVSK